jgi:hypothetical protein
MRFACWYSIDDGCETRPKRMRRVIIESPYAHELPEGVERHLRYLRACMYDCIHRGEAPYASHALYTQPGVLNDRDRSERKLGIDAGLVWKLSADATIVYTDLGVTEGMEKGMVYSKDHGQPIEFRRLGEGWDSVARFATEHWGRWSAVKRVT